MDLTYAWLYRKPNLRYTSGRPYRRWIFSKGTISVWAFFFLVGLSFLARCLLHLLILIECQWLSHFYTFHIAFGDYVLQFIPVNTLLRLRFVVKVILFFLDSIVVGINHKLLWLRFCLILSLVKLCFRDLEIEYWYWTYQGSGKFLVPSNDGEDIQNSRSW